MPEILNIGPFIVPSRLLVLLLGAVLGYLVMKYRLKKIPYDTAKILDIVTTGMLTVILVWKFGPAILSPSLIWENPINLLYMTGTSLHIGIGAALALAIMYIQLKKARIPIIIFLDALPFAVLPIAILYSLLVWKYGLSTSLPWGVTASDPNFTYHPLNIYNLFFLVPLLIWLWRSSPAIGGGVVFSRFLMAYGFGAMLVSYFASQDVVLLGISLEQMVYLGMILAGSFVKGKPDDRMNQQELSEV